MTDDAELLRRYAEENSEEAFAEFVRRNLGLVYHAGLRQCGGDVHRAQDVAQTVFTDVARKAGSLARRPALAGWLHTSTRYAAAQAVRGEVRRQRREQEAHAMNEILAKANGDVAVAAEWERMRPVIDEALHALPERDREAVLARFFEGRGFAEVGARLALSEDAARMRVERALEKLRLALVKRGVTSTATALGVALANQAGANVPAGLAASVTGAALAAGVGAGGALVFMGMSNLKSVLVSGVVVLVGGAAIFWEHRSHDREQRGLRDELSRLRKQMAALRIEAHETAGLRGENARLRDTLASSATGSKTTGLVVVAGAGAPTGRDEKKNRDAWRNVGRATPVDAYETVMWACDRGDLDALVAGFVLNDVQRAEAEVFFKRLPEESRAKYVTAERMMALLFASGTPAAWQLVTETANGADDVAVRARVWNDRGETNELELPFHRYPDGWRVVIPEWQMNKSLARLRK